MTTEILAPRDVQTTLNYYKPQTEVPYCYIGSRPPEGVPVHNIRHEPHPAIIHDVRGKQDEFRLDISGFQWVYYPSAGGVFVDDEERVKTIYYTEVEDLLKKHVGAKRVFIYDHVIRKNSEPETDPTRFRMKNSRGPLYSVHADHVFDFAEQKIRRCLPDDAERLLKGRYQIINVWRPIVNTVTHCPLGVVDFRSVDVAADLVPTRLIFPKRSAWMYNVKYNPGHQWYYLSDQTPDEVVLFKCFDSDADKARTVPHSAFPDVTSPPDASHRQSIEVRALVFDRE